MSWLKRYTYKEMYYEYFPGFFIGSTLFGTALGLATISNGPIRTIDAFMVTSVYTGIGMIMGVTYPISYPSFAILVVSHHLFKGI